MIKLEKFELQIYSTGVLAQISMATRGHVFILKQSQYA